MSKIDKVFRYAEQYAAEQYTDTGDMIKKEIESGKAELSALRARVEALEWVVKRLEYIEEYPAEEMLCPICRGEKPTHYEDCELVAALKA